MDAKEGLSVHMLALSTPLSEDEECVNGWMRDYHSRAVYLKTTMCSIGYNQPPGCYVPGNRCAHCAFLTTWKRYLCCECDERPLGLNAVRCNVPGCAYYARRMLGNTQSDRCCMHDVCVACGAESNDEPGKCRKCATAEFVAHARDPNRKGDSRMEDVD